MTRDWTQIACLAVRPSNNYHRIFSVYMWGYNWILFMLWWFCPIRLIHLIGRKSLHFKKKVECILKSYTKYWVQLKQNLSKIVTNWTEIQLSKWTNLGKISNSCQIFMQSCLFVLNNLLSKFQTVEWTKMITPRFKEHDHIKHDVF